MFAFCAYCQRLTEKIFIDSARITVCNDCGRMPKGYGQSDDDEPPNPTEPVGESTIPLLAAEADSTHSRLHGAWEAISGDLYPNSGKKIFEGDGGSYTTWTSEDQRIMAKVSGGLLALNPLGLVLPHYVDSLRVSFVLEGTTIVGVSVAGDRKEKVVRVKKDDVILLPAGNLTWWYNDSDYNFSVMFLGNTSAAIHPGEFSYFFLAGNSGIFNGFSINTLTMAWEKEKEIIEKLFKKQAGVFMIKLAKKLPGIQPSGADKRGIVLDFGRLPQGPSDVLMTAANIPMLKESKLAINFGKLAPYTLRSPGFYQAIQVVYIVKGSGRVEMAGTEGNSILDAEVKQGSLFVVPQFVPASITASDEGMEWISIILSPKPLFSQLTGKTSLLKAIAPPALAKSFNIVHGLLNFWT